jgi:succinoglycan biosynthesis protein ExoM
MTQTVPPPTVRVDVLICTYRRPHVVETIRSVATQDLPDGVSLRIVVADNDDAPSSQDRVRRAASGLDVPVEYRHAPRQNISVARNACLDAARGDWVAFIDDDETAERDWLARLLARAAETGADAVFGPALAEYPPEAPDWMRRQGVHANIPVARGGEVETGHTCNALLRRAGTPWRDERFDLGRGRSGGEDTEYFFRLRRRGARFAIAEDAVVREAVAPERLRLRWLLQRKFRMGQSFAARAQGRVARARLAGAATAKATFCALRGAAGPGRGGRRHFWTLRMALHAGVAAGCLRLPEREIYGGPDG